MANYDDILGKSLEEIQDIASLHQKSQILPDDKEGLEIEV